MVRPTIDTEWAESIIGLRLKVPTNWWARLSGTDLHDGKIVSFDEAKQKWNFVCDLEPEEVPYLMAYGAVYKYVDVSTSTFSRYVLPSDPMRGDGGEAIGITTRSSIKILDRGILASRAMHENNLTRYYFLSIIHKITHICMLRHYCMKHN